MSCLLNFYVAMIRALLQKDVYIGLTMKNSDWSKALNQYSISCEVNMITQYLQQVLHLSCRVQPLPSFHAFCLCSAIKLLQI